MNVAKVFAITNKDNRSKWYVDRKLCSSNVLISLLQKHSQYSFLRLLSLFME